MEIVVLILVLTVGFLFYKVNLLSKHVTVFSFSEKIINRLLVKKEIIKPSDIDVAINEAIGDIPESEGNKIIKYANSIGVNIPEYMDEKELEEYIQRKEKERAMRNIPYSDRLKMNDQNL